MKSKICSIMLSFLTVGAFAQDIHPENNLNAPGWGTNTPLKSLIEPRESMGFICWNMVPSATYVVDYLTPDGMGGYTCLGSKQTKKNYMRLDKDKFLGQSSFYQISAYNNGNGQLIEEGEIQAYIDDIPNTYYCHRDCNGPTYAYRLAIYEENYGQGNTFMIGEYAAEAYDAQNDIVVPYYQAISSEVYDQLPPNHPYKEAIGYFNGTGGVEEVYLYKHVEITPSFAYTSGPFVDVQGNVVDDGWLIEKKPDQFNHFVTALTTGNPSINQCDGQVSINTGGAWINYFNSYVDPNSLQQVDLNDVLPFTTTVPEELVCDNTPSGIPGPIDNSIEYDFVNIFDNCWAELLSIDIVFGELDPSTIEAYINCLEGVNLGSNSQGGDILVTGVQFVPVGHGGSVVFVSADDEVSDTEIKKFKDGLYQINLFTNTASVVPLFSAIETKKNTLKRDDIKIALKPTVINNNLVKFDISTEKDMTVDILVYDIDGNVYHSESVLLSSSYDETREVQVNNSNLPQNQVRVKVTCDDGSFKEEIALKLN